MLTLCAGLLVNAGAVVPSGSEVAMEVSALLTEHVGPAPDLATAERNPGLAHLKEDLPEGGVHLLNHPGPLVLLSLNHPESLVLIILGHPFQFKASLHSS